MNRLSCSLAIAMLACAPAANAAPNLPAKKTFRFVSQQTQVLPGSSGERNSGFNCTGVIKPADQIGRLAIVSTKYQNGCYGSGNYSNINYKVERGTVSASRGAASYPAYRVHAPAQRARRFLASRHYVFYKFPARRSYTVYRFVGGAMSTAQVVPASTADPSRFIKLNINASLIGKPVVFVVAPSNARLSTLARVGAGVEAARVAQTAIGDVYQYRYAVNGTPFDTRTGYTSGPASFANVYSAPRRFFPVTTAGGFAVLWQDAATKALKITTMSKAGRAVSTRSVANPRHYTLAAAASDGANRMFFLLVQPGNGARHNVARGVYLVKATTGGQVTTGPVIDASRGGLNITKFDGNVASMRYARGKLGVMLGRTMHRSRDGLNHQGGIAIVFSADTLRKLHNTGQTSGHSFENVLTVDRGDQFVGIDLGDNYPRGVHLHKFTRAGRRSAVVYTFKTQHGSRAVSPAGRRYPVYAAISRGGKTFYKWSNDNRTYTELGGVVQAKDGSYVVVFATETHRGRGLDNARVGGAHNDPRNIGLVRVRGNFDRLRSRSRGNVVSDAMMLTRGRTETGGFYTFGGRWSPQRNTGVVWLTGYADKTRANVSRLKVAGLKDGNLLVLWEKWTPTHYVSTHAMKVSGSGKRLSKVVDLGSTVRLSRRGDVLVRGNDVYVVAGDGAGRSLDVFVLRVK